MTLLSEDPQFLLPGASGSSSRRGDKRSYVMALTSGEVRDEGCVALAASHGQLSLLPAPQGWRVPLAAPGLPAVSRNPGSRQASRRSSCRGGAGKNLESCELTRGHGDGSLRVDSAHPKPGLNEEEGREDRLSTPWAPEEVESWPRRCDSSRARTTPQLPTPLRLARGLTSVRSA